MDLLAWQRSCLIEPSVCCVLADLVRSGDVVFDVGSHHANLSLVLGRLVGPKGQVVAFEANPETAAIAAENVRRNCVNNVFVVNRAVTDKSGDILPLYFSGGVGDSLFSRTQNERHVNVRTIQLDEFIEESGLVPRFLKFDVEGAEELALKGLETFIDRHFPAIILEQNTSEFACIEFLQKRNYIAVDLHTYRPLRVIEDYQSDKPVVRNVLCLHPSHLAERPSLLTYVNPLERSVARFAPEDMEVDGRSLMSPTLSLEAGRYNLEVIFDIAEGDAPLRSGISHAGDWLSCYHGYVRLLDHGYRDMPFHLEHPLEVRIAITRDEDQPITSLLRGVKIHLKRMNGFGTRPMAAMVLS